MQQFKLDPSSEIWDAVWKVLAAKDGFARVPGEAAFNSAVANSGRAVDWLHIAGPRYLPSEDHRFLAPLSDLDVRDAHVFLYALCFSACGRSDLPHNQHQAPS
ncbi:MAG: hypothetical protein JO097_15985 [Acidobacteriaceae bacterium]|nr:hypothetical protein [Acidobacteriaceae bacterium]MBV9746600.1 hypothetical protein [Terriglobia bacterium]